MDRHLAGPKWHRQKLSRSKVDGGYASNEHYEAMFVTTGVANNVECSFYEKN